MDAVDRIHAEGLDTISSDILDRRVTLAFWVKHFGRHDPHAISAHRTIRGLRVIRAALAQTWRVAA